MAGRWGSGDRVVVASHGITANHMSFAAVAAHVVAKSAGEVSVVAVDHRGRGGSADTPGPYGLSVHGDDLIAVLGHLDVEKGVLVGHSLGGFIAANAAERHPDRVRRLVLIDGGVPFASTPAEVDPDADIEAIVLDVVGPALARLDVTFESLDQYLGLFQQHPAFVPPNEWTSAAEAYVRHDAVVAADGTVRSTVKRDAVMVDGGAAFTDPASASSIRRVDVATTLVWCPRGLVDETPGLYAPDYLHTVAGELSHLTTVLADDTNHYTVVTAERGAGLVADEIIEAAR